MIDLKNDDGSIKKVFDEWFEIARSDESSDVITSKQYNNIVFTCPDCKYQHKKHEYNSAFCVNCDTLLS